jgi:FtsZ-binding cell division protein ZapB
MISLEQIRLLEAKIARAIDLIRVLKEENATLRKGLDSAQRRMKELEGLVDGFKTDQKEIEAVILRTLKNLDDLEESAARKPDMARAAAPAREPAPAGASPALPNGPSNGGRSDAATEADAAGDASAKGELDIF